MNREPVLISSALITVVTAVVGVLVAFNVWHPSDTEVQAIATAITALVPFLGFFVRSKVTPVAAPNLPVPPTGGAA